ncbi:hypothetical protein BST61_g7830 [Cercospora zeina]
MQFTSIIVAMLATAVHLVAAAPSPNTLEARRGCPVDGFPCLNDSDCADPTPFNSCNRRCIPDCLAHDENGTCTEQKFTCQ